VGSEIEMSKIDDILKTEFSESFVKKMKNRMVASYGKYGPIRDNAGDGRTNVILSLKDRLRLYEETGNTEWLIDAANMCMIEFMYPQHKKAHFRATDSGESPGIRGVTINDLKQRLGYE